MPYDPSAYRGTASYYTSGRPPYSLALLDTLSNAICFDGTGRMLDVGCGPGVLTVELAPKFGKAVALDPDPGMLAEGRRRAKESSCTNIRWIQGVAEHIPNLEIGPCRLVTFGQSFHWTDRERVAEIVYDLLEPGGTIALIVHTVEGRPVPPSAGHPPIPHDEIKELITRYLSAKERPPEGKRVAPDRYEDALARTRFGVPQIALDPGRPDIVRSIDSVVAGYFSMSFAAPHLFGPDRDQFEAELRAILRNRSSDGLFWDWPGDTEIVMGHKRE